MNILFCSVPFQPSVGGLETVSAILAERLHAMGHAVVLVTHTEWRGTEHTPFPVVRRPGARSLFELVRNADVVLHNNISLKFAWPLLLIRRPWVIAHHMWTPRAEKGEVLGRLKHWCSRFARNIAVSRAMADSLTVPAVVIPNPYADHVFMPIAGIARNEDLIFVGRLVSGKGVPVLLEALARLKSRGVRPRLTIVGTGPDEATLRRQAEALAITDQVHFAGLRRGVDLVAALCAHKVVVIPSVWEEPFGVVALEAIACGCAAIVSRSGGLPDAVGRCGMVVPKNDSAALASAIERLVSDSAARSVMTESAPGHLAEHTRDRIAQRYMEVIDDAYRSDRS